MASCDDVFGDKQLRSVVSDVDRGRRYGNLDSSSEDSGNEGSIQRVEHAIVHISSPEDTRPYCHGSSTLRPIKRTINKQSSERSPLIRPRQEGDISDGLDPKPTTLPRRYGTTPVPLPKKQIKLPPQPTHWLIEQITKTLLLRSTSVMVFMLLMVLGIVLTAAANLNLDQKGLQIEPPHVLIYIMCLMFVFILWVTYSIFPQTFKSSNPSHGSLIPSHLLTGIGIFGTVAAMAEMMHFVDYVKCSRHVKNLSEMYGIYPFVKSFFMYCQIYFFYKLSRDGIRNYKIPGGNFFLMVTLATNLCIWWTGFLNDASNDPKLKNITWLNHYHFGIKGSDPCTNGSITSAKAKQLHNMVAELQPYILTCSMEYVLLASGLLLHVWLSMNDSNSSKSQVTPQQYWTLWRVGFIVGLLSIPSVVVAYIHQNHVKKVGTAKVILCCFQGTICTVLLICSLYCTLQAQKFFKKMENQPMKLEVVILGVSFIGIPILDLCNCYAAVAEFNHHLPTPEVVWFGLSSIADLVAAGLQFFFIKTAYEHRLPEVADSKARKAAQRIRQFASFALVVNIAYWGAKTKELRRSPKDSTVSEVYFGSYAYFALGHLAYPLCIFFHFHLAICFANVVSFYSKFGPLYYFAQPVQQPTGRL